MSETTQFTNCGHADNARREINALIADVAAIRAALVAITAQLDTDAGVTDTDYASNDPAAQTSAALTET